jgi:hypothetical protein
MRRVFSVAGTFPVRDGTLVAPLLNPLDAESGLDRRIADALPGLSVAYGRIVAGKRSKIHFHPYIAVVTLVLKGKLVVRMHGVDNDHRERLRLAPLGAVLAEPGTFQQLVNKSGHDTTVLYLASPSYVFLTSADGSVLYDDAVVLKEGWRKLEENGWVPSVEPPDPDARRRARLAVLSRLPDASGG